MSDLYQKFQVASIYMMQMQNENFKESAAICFWIVVIKIPHIRTDQPLKMGFSDSGDLKTCKSIKNLHFEKLTQKQYFLYFRVREVKTKRKCPKQVLLFLNVLFIINICYVSILNRNMIRSFYCKISNFFHLKVMFLAKKINNKKLKV